jgi:hypothetical protein
MVHHAEELVGMKALFTLILGSHELFVSGEGLKDFILYALTDGIPVDRPCRCGRLRVSHVKNETASP